MSLSAKHLFKLLPAALLLASCETSSSIKGLPKDLPVINLHGSPSTPVHGMARADYPFNPDGSYNNTWAAEGGQGAGMDYSSWRSSHGGSSSRSSSRSSSKKKTTSSSKSKSKSGSKSGGGTYAIKSGDTLGAIARKNGTTVAKLKAANGLSGDMIRAGKTLKIPR
ncbi:MAG: LysM peptidoglycan-binding domain-containing protein [Prosthecobacter sp.]